MHGRKTPGFIRIGIGILISAVFLWLVIRQIDLNQVFREVRNINALWIIPAILVYFIGVWVRTTRWCILMRPISKNRTSQLFPIYIISYMANNILPMRIGDIYRAYIAGKKQNVSKSATLVTIGVERIFDGLTMLILLFVSILFFPIENQIVRKVATLGSIVFLGAILICYAVILKKAWMNWIFRTITGKTRFGNNPRMQEVFDNLLHGLDSLKAGNDIFRVLILSLSTWLIEAASYYLVLNAFGFFGTFLVAMATMAMVNLVIIIPSAPGYFGPFELACFIILGSAGYGDLTGFSENVATAYALILHVVVQWIPSTLLGLVFMWREHISFREINTD
ncbi:flippase-like domain-containing protein [bacterium]|nr:flippase-like domain-containing protein [candidate division CSSED10-310 bacterium]